MQFHLTSAEVLQFVRTTINKIVKILVLCGFLHHCQSFYFGLTDEQPIARIGCTLSITKIEADAATDSIYVGGVVIPYAYDTKDDRYFVLIGEHCVRSIQFFDNFVRATRAQISSV